VPHHHHVTSSPLPSQLVSMFPLDAGNFDLQRDAEGGEGPGPVTAPTGSRAIPIPVGRSFTHRVAALSIGSEGGSSPVDTPQSQSPSCADFERWVVGGGWWGWVHATLPLVGEMPGVDAFVCLCGGRGVREKVVFQFPEAALGSVFVRKLGAGANAGMRRACPIASVCVFVGEGCVWCGWLVGWWWSWHACGGRDKTWVLGWVASLSLAVSGVFVFCCVWAAPLFPAPAPPPLLPLVALCNPCTPPSHGVCRPRCWFDHKIIPSAGHTHGVVLLFIQPGFACVCVCVTARVRCPPSQQVLGGNRSPWWSPRHPGLLAGPTELQWLPARLPAWLRL
jgi:hypothetical protein